MKIVLVLYATRIMRDSRDLLGIGANGPYAYLIRRSNRRLTVVLGGAALLVTLTFLM